MSTPPIKNIQTPPQENPLAGTGLEGDYPADFWDSSIETEDAPIDAGLEGEGLETGQSSYSSQDLRNMLKSSKGELSAQEYNALIGRTNHAVALSPEQAQAEFASIVDELNSIIANEPAEVTGEVSTEDGLVADENGVFQLNAPSEEPTDYTGSGAARKVEIATAGSVNISLKDPLNDKVRIDKAGSYIKITLTHEGKHELITIKKAKDIHINADPENITNKYDGNIPLSAGLEEPEELLSKDEIDAKKKLAERAKSISSKDNISARGGHPSAYGVGWDKKHKKESEKEEDRGIALDARHLADLAAEAFEKGIDSAAAEQLTKNLVSLAQDPNRSNNVINLWIRATQGILRDDFNKFIQGLPQTAVNAAIDGLRANPDEKYKFKGEVSGYQIGGIVKTHEEVAKLLEDIQREMEESAPRDDF